MSVRTRFAPSPTGLLHVGGVRTALYSWLFAKHHDGEFILRIEDTDRERSTQESVNAIIDGMAWLGLTHDGDIIYQTDRYARYDEVIQQLLDADMAYYCDCSKQRLEQLRAQQLENKQKPRYDGCCRDKGLDSSTLGCVVRFRNPLSGAVSFTDAVYGEITVQNSELDDLIIKRSDGNPTYNFTVVVDDWDMQITHVIRGDDHINNTPRQINLFNALGANIPVYSHLPMILGEDGRRLSKRHGAVGVMEFKKQGILPQALLNYLVRLGWSYGDQEIFSMQQMIDLFDLNNVSRGVSTFNYDKLYWLNQHYLRQGLSAEVEAELIWHFKQQNLDISNGPQLSYLVNVMAERCQNCAELVQKSYPYYVDDIEYDGAAVKKHLRPVVMEPLKALFELLQQLPAFDSENINQAINQVVEQYELKMPKIAQPLRVAITGGSMSPGIDDTLLLVGQDRSIKRIEKAIEIIQQRIDESA